MKVKELYNKYINWIVVILLLLFTLKGCQSCSRNRVIEYNQNQYEQSESVLNDYIDSMEMVIQCQNYRIDSLNTVIVNKDFQLNILNNELGELKESVKHYRNTNTTLVNTNRELTNKTE